MKPRLALLLPLLLLVASPAPAAVFDISFDSAVRSEPGSGRVELFLIRPGSSIAPGRQPAGDYFFSDPQPIYSTAVSELKPGEAARIDDSAASFPVKPSALPPGHYRGQAVLDMHRESGDFRHEPGNLYSDVVEFDIARPDDVIPVKLTKVVEARKVPHVAGVDVMDVRSELLSKFRGTDVHLHAGVVWPLDYQPGRKYPAVYVVPGFGGDHFGAFGQAAANAKLPAGSPQREFYRNVFWIVLDPDGPNGHTLFADSDVNGPCGAALVKELIPALEAKFPLIPKADGRMLRGHSSGGWSVLWLAVTYPETFGACWCYSPDPIDFHRLERVNIYEQANAYVDRDSRPGHEFDTPSFRSGGKTLCTARLENEMEGAVGPDNSSAGQWDSWQAVWGHRNAAGNPVPLFDPETGQINRQEAEYYKRHDIGELLRRDPERIGQILQRRVRLLTGELDNYYLNEGAEYLKATLEGLNLPTPAAERHGYVKVIAGAGHGGTLSSPEGQAFNAEVLEHLKRCGYLPTTRPATTSASTTPATAP